MDHTAIKFLNLFTDLGFVKSRACSDFYRKNGDTHFAKGQFYEALVSYNESLRAAYSGSQEMGVAYANRSAAYYKAKMYDKSIENIHLARQNGYPAEKLRCLDFREEMCKEMLNKGGHNTFDPWSFFKLSHPANDKIPFIVNCLELGENDKFGRFILTNQDLKTGDIVAIEEPLFKFTEKDKFDYNRCSFCLASKKLSFIPCLKCSLAMYCSEVCLENDTFHQRDCTICEYKNSPDEMSLPVSMIYKSVRISGRTDEMVALLKNSGSKTVFDFDLSNPKDPSYEKNLLKAVNSLSTIANPYKSLTYDTNELRRMSLRQLGIYQTNSFYLDESYREMLDDGTGHYTSRNIGSSIFPFASLLNHSCYPNVKHITVDNKFVIIATRPIKAGEQLFISYGYSFFRFTRKEREERLARYKFKIIRSSTSFLKSTRILKI